MLEKFPSQVDYLSQQMKQNNSCEDLDLKILTSSPSASSNFRLVKSKSGNIVVPSQLLKRQKSLEGLKNENKPNSINHGSLSSTGANHPKNVLKMLQFVLIPKPKPRSKKSEMTSKNSVVQSKSTQNLTRKTRGEADHTRTKDTMNIQVDSKLLRSPTLKSNIKKITQKTLSNLPSQKKPQISAEKQAAIQDMIRSNIKKMEDQLRLQRSQEHLRDQHERMRSAEIVEMNDKIRKTNFINFKKKKKKAPPKESTHNIKHLTSQEKQSNKNQNLGPITKTQRRRDIGLAFLNSLETERIKKIVRKNQEKLKKTITTEQGPKSKPKKDHSISDHPFQPLRRKSKSNLRSPLLLEKLKSESNKSKKQEMLKKLIKMNARVREENQQALKSSGTIKQFFHPKKFTLAFEDNKPQELSLGDYLEHSKLNERVSNNQSESKLLQSNFNVLYSEYKQFFSEIYNNSATKAHKSGAKSLKILKQQPLITKKNQQRSRSKTAKTGTSSAGKSNSKIVSKLVHGLVKKVQSTHQKAAQNSATIQPARSDGFNFLNPLLEKEDERLQKTQDLRIKKKGKGNVVELSDLEQPHVFSDSSLLMSSRDSKDAEQNHFLSKEDINPLPSSKNRSENTRIVDPETGLLVTQKNSQRANQANTRQERRTQVRPEDSSYLLSQERRIEEKIRELNKHSAATFIQKMFRGYIVRKKVEELIEYLKFQDSSEDELGSNYDDEVVINLDQNSNKSFENFMGVGDIGVGVKGRPNKKTVISEISLERESHEIFAGKPMSNNQNFADQNNGTYKIPMPISERQTSGLIVPESKSSTLSRSPVKDSSENDQGQKIHSSARESIREKVPELKNLTTLNSKLTQSSNISQGQEQGENIVHNLAKMEYLKWSRMKNMIHSIEAKLGAKAAEEVKSLLKEIETYTETSKKNLKDAFFANEAAISNQPSEIRRLSNLEESKLRSDKFSTSIQGDKFSSKTKDKVKAQHLDFKNEASISDLYKYSQFGFNSQMIDPLSLNIPSSNLLLPGSSNFQFQQAESIIDIKQAAQREKPSVVSFLN